jgi:hypothetical protein
VTSPGSTPSLKAIRALASCPSIGEPVVTGATGETDVAGDVGEAAATATGETGKGETGETGATLMASTTLDPRTPNWPHMREDEALVTLIGCEWRRIWMALITRQNHCGSKTTMSDSMGEDGVDGRSESHGIWREKESDCLPVLPLILDASTSRTHTLGKPLRSSSLFSGMLFSFSFGWHKYECLSRLHPHAHVSYSGI